MIYARLPLEEESDEVIAMARENIDETMAGEPFDPEMARATYQSYLDNANPTFFVAEEARQLIGFVQTYALGYDYRSGLYTTQKVLFVRPHRRGSRASVVLMKALIDWSRRMGADRIIGGNDNAFNSERTAKFLGHFGFQRVGHAMILSL